MRWEKFQEILDKDKPSLQQICKEMDIPYLEKNMAMALVLMTNGLVHYDDLNSMEDHK
jgi:hypothetical protein